MADGNPERVLGDITNRQQTQNRSPRPPQPTQSRSTLPLNENTPLSTTTVPQLQSETTALQSADFSAMNPQSSSSMAPPVSAPILTQPSDKTGSIIDLRVRVPADYPPLEPVIDALVPLHFTWTGVEDISNDMGSFCTEMYAMIDEIDEQFQEREHLFWWSISYCQVEKPRRLIREESEYTGIEYGEVEQVYEPQLLVVQAMPRAMHLHWREAHTIVQEAILRRFGTEFQLPIRFYYGDTDQGFKRYGSPGDTTAALPMANNGVTLRDAKEHQPKELRNMGTTIGIKDGVRMVDPNGTLGCFIRLRDANNNLLPDVFALTNHHVVSLTTGDQIPPPPSRGQDQSSASRRPIAHPPVRDFENNNTTLNERMKEYETTIEIYKQDMQNDPSTDTDDIRGQMILRLEDEIKVDKAQLVHDTHVGHKAIGSVWATSGRSGVKTPTKFKGSKEDAGKLWLSDWALIKLDRDEEGQNLLPPTLIWPTDYPAEFDQVRAHGEIHGIGEAKPGDLVGYAGRSGIHFGHIQTSRKTLHLQKVLSATSGKSVNIVTEEVVIFGINDQIPFAWNGDSGSAVFNTAGQFVGLLHSGRPKDLVLRPCLFTPAQDLCEDIKQKTGHTLEWIVPNIQRPCPIPPSLRCALGAAADFALSVAVSLSGAARCGAKSRERGNFESETWQSKGQGPIEQRRIEG